MVVYPASLSAIGNRAASGNSLKVFPASPPQRAGIRGRRAGCCFFTTVCRFFPLQSLNFLKCCGFGRKKKLNRLLYLDKFMLRFQHVGVVPSPLIGVAIDV